jgi:hypothetical protein
MHVTLWVLAAVAFGAAGVWWALTHVSKFPTIRLFLALVAGGALAVVLSSWIITLSTWYGHLVSGLPSPFPTLLTVAPVAVFATALTLVLVAAHPKEYGEADRTAEILAVCAVAVLLFVSGASGPVMTTITHITKGGAA